METLIGSLGWPLAVTVFVLGSLVLFRNQIGARAWDHDAGFHMKFVQTGGARIGSMNASWPFATLSADRHAIVLCCLFKFAFPRDGIIRLSRYRGFFSTGLQIEHDVPRYPRFMVFWTFSFDVLKAKLEALGYMVRD